MFSEGKALILMIIFLKNYGHILELLKDSIMFGLKLKFLKFQFLALIIFGHQRIILVYLFVKQCLELFVGLLEQIEFVFSCGNCIH
jgi:hypothetical protein